MKKIQYLFFGLLATFVLAGCNKDDVTYTPGKGNQPDTYGVYFPTQVNPTTCDLDPADPTTLSYTIKRTNDRGKITVPVVVTASPANVFEVEPIVFEDGQFEQEFNINFPDAEIGVTYEVNIAVVDEAYIAVNGIYPTGIDLTITRAEWKQVIGPNGEQTGKWRDDFLTSMMGSNIQPSGQPNAEKDVIIWERADKPGYYRIQNIYDEEYMRLIIGTKFSNVPSVPTYTIIDATDKEKVWFPTQTTGWEINDVGYEDNGKFIIFSFCQENCPDYASATLYGTEVNGVITFPSDAIILSLPTLWKDGSYYRSNTPMTRIMLPGARLFDYSVSLTKSEPRNGIVTISATLGADVDKIKYTIFEGSLSDGDVNLKVNDMLDGKIDFTGELSESGNIEVQMEETGVYTLVSCIFDADGKSQGYTYISFGYVTADEERPVVISVRTELTWEKEALGYTPENSIKGIIFGQDIESGYIGLFKTSDLTAYPESIWGEYAKVFGKALTADQLAAINGTGYLPFYTGLNKGTSYTLLVNAYNGFYSKTVAVEQTTQGDPNPLEIIYTTDDAIATVPKEDLFNTTWNYYAVDLSDQQNQTIRQYLGKVTFNENTADDAPDADMIDIHGLTAVASYLDEGDDPLVSEWYRGQVYPGVSTVIGKYKGNYVSTRFMAEEAPTSIFSTAYCLLGLYVDDGIIAFLPNDSYVEQGYTFTTLYTAVWTDYDPTSGTFSGQLYYLSKLKHLLLVSPENDPNADTAAAVSRKLREMTPANNYVELRGPELMKALWQEASGKPVNFGQNPLQGERPTSIEVAPASTQIVKTPERPAAISGNFVKQNIRLSSVIGK